VLGTVSHVRYGVSQPRPWQEALAQYLGERRSKSP
jgi:hypothetical protein